ncbi:MAG: glycosyltransferase [Sulfitobacter litoralis]|jgi:glycosyltransferase involved in cell wall biosynthesis|uniref:Glycosyl transferase family 2 n=1 Tax=Sulfitobacter litoralis TaxID=335975 RepID=A0ABY0S838_9RHOB|nr:MULTISPECIES: glycosyltransferase [Sulfitobacter]MBQ0765619.1 glycosyltransferase [Sulfitobacter litoralis]MBQ0801642.1 glycosyltransferase [Sulfitobacter litoralis]MCF7778697.1 glycosyltransferase [Sulfitobacter sp. M220]SDO90471.1 Glycosyl transferase family 2 [Sulfitobacter litoralis]|tara:strand:- start:5261 stop:6184 length:924 start_codon:yes stop_codon:yes gene_type:complete
MNQPHVHILMGTKNAGAFLSDQLASIRRQNHRDWSLWISDDSSIDSTWEGLLDFRSNTPEYDIRLLKGPNVGVAANYFYLLAQRELAGQWVAFCDQDDVWLPHKISRGVKLLKDRENSHVYSSRSFYVDAKLSGIGVSPEPMRPCHFGNSIVQNCLRGNTIICPPGVTDYLRSILYTTANAEIPFHDWWMYQALTGAGFSVIHDRKPSILYRQHNANVMGAPVSHLKHRLVHIAKGEFANWVDSNASAMLRLSSVLDAPARGKLLRFLDWRMTCNTRRRPTLNSMGIYRQTYVGDIALNLFARCGWL